MLFIVLLRTALFNKHTAIPALFVGLFLFDTVHAEQPLQWEPVPQEELPALLYIESGFDHDPPNFSTLKIATFPNGTVKFREILTSKYININQLDETVFLVEASQRPKDTTQWENIFYLMDFVDGTETLLSQSISRDKLVHLQCLGTSPDRHRAMLLRYGQGTTQTDLLDVDLSTCTMKNLLTIPGEETFAAFREPHILSSPDFRYIAAMYLNGDTNKEDRISSYTLCILDLNTMNVVLPDNDVSVQISLASSSLRGKPPYIWIDNRHILYQHMIPVMNIKENLGLNPTYILKCVDVINGDVTEWLRINHVRDASLTGGFMRRNAFTNEIRYCEFGVDIEKRQLVQLDPGYLLEFGKKRTEIRFGEDVLFRHDGGFSHAECCITNSRLHLAYFVRYDSGGGKPTIFAKIKQHPEVIKVSEVPFYSTIEAWIEDNNL